MINLDIPNFFLPPLLLFVRSSGVFAAAPGLGDANIPVRYRLLFCLALGFCLPPQKVDPSLLMHDVQGPLIFLYEACIGVLLGFMSRLFISLLNVLGSIISLQIGLGNAMVFNPSLGAQTTVLEQYVMMGGVMLFFAMDMHHLLVRALIHSYEVLPILNFQSVSTPFLDIITMLPEFFVKSFRAAAELSLPFLILGLVFQCLLGLLSRVVPSLQVFFIALPLQIFLGFLLLLGVMGLVLSLSLKEDFLPLPPMFIEGVAHG